MSGLSRYRVEIYDEFAGNEYRAVLWARSPETAAGRYLSSIDFEEKINLSGQPRKVTRLGFPLKRIFIFAVATAWFGLMLERLGNAIAVGEDGAA